MPTISASVGRMGKNIPVDVKTVQGLLNMNGHKMAPFQKLAVDGKIGPKTQGAIDKFQKNVLRYNKIDGRVDPGKKMIQTLNQGARNGAGPGTGAPGGGSPAAPGTIKSNVGNLNLLVTRIKAYDQSVIGTLSVNGTQICYTLEEAWRNNQKGHSCVSLGNYTAFIRYNSTKSNREWCFQLHDANGRSAIQIHIGNKPSHTEGCILVGTSYSENFVSNSTVAYQKLQDFVFGAGFTRADIRKAKPEFGNISVKFVDQTPGISGRI